MDKVIKYLEWLIDDETDAIQEIEMRERDLISEMYRSDNFNLIKTRTNELENLYDSEEQRRYARALLKRVLKHCERWADDDEKNNF